MYQHQKIEVDDFEKRPTKLGNLTHSDKTAEAAEEEALDILTEVAEAEALESLPQKRSLTESGLKNLYL